MRNEHATIISHKCWLSWARCFSQKVRSTFFNSTQCCGITEIGWVTSPITAIIIKGAAFFIPIVGRVVESAVNLVPAHVFQERKCESRESFLNSELSACHQLVVHHYSFPMRSWRSSILILKLHPCQRIAIEKVFSPNDHVRSFKQMALTSTGM